MTARTPASLLSLASAAACLAVSLAGCASTPPTTAKGPPPPLATEQYKPTVTRAPEQVALAIHPQGLSVNQKAALADFVGRWRDNGGDIVTVKAPTDSLNPGLALRTANATSAYMAYLGVPTANLRLEGYVSGHAPGAPVLASFSRYEALGPDCSQGWDNLTSTKSNAPSTHFGCAGVANLAVMIANPRDLAGPAAVDPADNSRRQIVLGKYRQGQNTSSAADTQASGTVSQ